MTLPTQYYIYIGKTLGCHHAPKGVAATFFRAVRGAWLAVLICFTAVLPGVLAGCGSEAPPMGDAVRTAQGLAAWLCATELPQKCAIGYDSRHNSRRYAEICAVGH